MNICLVSSELAPFAKTGGLADVVPALASFLHRSGHDVRVFMPLYSSIDDRHFDVRPVASMQGMRLGTIHGPLSYSIDTAGLPGTSLDINLVRCPALYDRPSLYTDGADEHLRFMLLSRAALESCQRSGWSPDIVHCNDWHAGLVPLYLRTLYKWDRLFSRTRSVLTIHNIGYQGIFSADTIPSTGLADSEHLFHSADTAAGIVNFLKTGILYADALTTVSPTYAEEIQTDEYGMGLQDLLRERKDSLVGILNGVDYEEWSPETDRLIPYRYSRASRGPKNDNKKHLMSELGLHYEEHTALVGLVSRFTAQKGIDLIAEALPAVLDERDLSVAVLGSGERRYEELFSRLQERFPGRLCYYRGFNEKLAHLIEAGSDLFLMPSRYEPCGLNQMYSLRYGTIPIVRATGGLADSVRLYDPETGEGTGIVFKDYNGEALYWGLNAALGLYSDRDAWNRLQQNAMSQDFSWDKQGPHYVALYESLGRNEL